MPSAAVATSVPSPMDRDDHCRREGRSLEKALGEEELEEDILQGIRFEEGATKARQVAQANY